MVRLAAIASSHSRQLLPGGPTPIRVHFSRVLMVEGTASWQAEARCSMKVPTQLATVHSRLSSSSWAHQSCGQIGAAH